MKDFSDFYTDFMLSAAEGAPAPGGADDGKEEAASKTEVTATTEQPVPLAPQVTGALEPISGGQVFILVMFGVLSAIGLVALTRYGSKNNYGD